jgi:hypothetical protein
MVIFPASHSRVSSRAVTGARASSWVVRWGVSLAAAAVALTGAGCSGPLPGSDPVGRTSERIAFGSADSAHTAVVALLAPAGPGFLQECSGSIVQVKNGNGYVLTAAHCCNQYVPNVVVVSSDFTVGEQYVAGGTPVPPSHAVVSGSVYYDSLYNGAGTDHDFCMLEFSGATAGTASLALPAASGDGLQLGSPIEHIGYGLTETGTSNTQRRTGTDTIDVALTPSLVEFTQGGANRVPGTCEGDSGGPSLLPAGVPQSQQVVVAVQSFGNSTGCSSTTLSGASRVLSEIGAGRFITSYLADSPIGTHAGAASVPGVGPWALAALAGALALAGLRARQSPASPSCPASPS